MHSRVAAPRVMTLAAVAGLHAAALLWLLTETRIQRVRSGPESAPILVVILQSLAPSQAAGGMQRRARLPRTRVAGGSAMQPAPSTAITNPAEVSIDWAAEASSAAQRLVERNERSHRQANALSPAPSTMFAPPGTHHRELPWQNRVESVEGGATVIHLGDRCALVLLVIIPMLGCSLDKMPAHGDLFDHMHDHD